MLKLVNACLKTKLSLWNCQFCAKNLNELGRERPGYRIECQCDRLARESSQEREARLQDQGFLRLTLKRPCISLVHNIMARLSYIDKQTAFLILEMKSISHESGRKLKLIKWSASM